jgi:hypothetical protein
VSKLSFNLAFSYLGILVCIGRLASVPSYEILVALALFIANLNLRKLFKHLQKQEVDNADVKIHQLNKKLLELEDDYRKSINALKFQGIIR